LISERPRERLGERVARDLGVPRVPVEGAPHLRELRAIHGLNTTLQLVHDRILPHTRTEPWRLGNL